jgi:hypothetical protein
MKWREEKKKENIKSMMEMKNKKEAEAGEK